MSDERERFERWAAAIRLIGRESVWNLTWEAWQAARVAELEARLQTIIDAYNAYRRRGVIPAPGEYAAVVAAIDAARAALAKS